MDSESSDDGDGSFFADFVIRDGNRVSLNSRTDDSGISRIMALARNDVMEDGFSDYHEDEPGDSIFDDDDDDDGGRDNDFMNRTPVRLSNTDTGQPSKFTHTSSLPNRLSPLQISSPHFSKKRRTAAAKAPKDPCWSITFILMVPFFLFFVPSYSSPNFHSNNLLGGEPLPHVLSVAPTFTLFLTTLAIGPMLSKVLYTSDRGSELHPSQLISSLAHPSGVSKFVLFGLVIVSLILTPKWGVFVVTPLVFWWLIVKFLKKVQKKFCPSSNNQTSTLADYEVDPQSSYLESTQIPEEDDSESNVSFITALFEMCLSILSRPVRRRSSPRSPPNPSASCIDSLKTLTYIALLMNFIVVGLSLHLGLYPLLQFDNQVPWVPLTAFLAAGFWSTAVIRRIVGLVSSCIVYAWFERQGVLVGRLAQATPAKSDEGYSNFRVVNRTGYSQVGDDPDDDDDDSGGGGEDAGNRNEVEAQDDLSTASPSGSNNMETPTVQSFVIQAVTVSFGSVVKCAMLGGLAQFAWGVVRYLDEVERFRQRRKRGGGHMGGFNSMNIGDVSSGNNSVSAAFRVYTVLKAFVRSYNDFGLAHCAAYCKSYRRAAFDVYALIEESKVDVILAGDRTTSTCSSCCVTIAGTITMSFGGIVLLTGSGKASDHQIAAMLLINFAVCYMTLFSILEGLRAGVKSIYICFAEHPAAISQRYPIIFHRFSRKIEEAGTI